ncbi:MAG: FAD-dependent oxidoreductase [Candidatus Limnocylindrales bacterium]
MTSSEHGPRPDASVTSGNAGEAAGIADLEGSSFDAVVVGGGILGAGVAREMARRGLRTLLVERQDFGWGTTARSTRLIHGGLRYLATYDFGLVREGLRERAWQLRHVPNLVTPLPFLLPFYDTPLWQRLRLRAGLTLYDLLSPHGTLPRHRTLSAQRVAELEPGLARSGLQGAGQYWDAQVELPERLVLEALRAAVEAGAQVRNHVAATGLEIVDGQVRGVHLTAAGGDRARVRTVRVVNATGQWADAALAGMAVRRPPLLRLVQGVHLVYGRLAEYAVAFEHPDDRRLCFAVPWQGLTLVGTTETEVAGSADEARVTASEVRYLERGIEAVLPTAAGTPPYWAAVGVRSLLPIGRVVHDVSRRHVIVDHAPDGAAGLATVAGGKLTAWRSIAADATDEILGRRDPAALRDVDVGLAPVPPRPAPGGGPVALRLWHLYGGRMGEVAALAADPWWAQPLLPGHDALRAEVLYAYRVEWAASVADVVLRRLALGFGPDLGRGAAAAVAEIGAARLGWDVGRVERELAQFEAENEERRLPPPRDGAPAAGPGPR